MTHRISISIPNELHDRIKQYKGELNVSQVCQKALIAATDRIEKKESITTHSGSIAERLLDEFIRENEAIVKNEALDGAFNAALGLSLSTVKEFIEDPSEFYNADPETLFKLYGDDPDTSSAYYESAVVRSLYAKEWSQNFCIYLTEIKDDFERLIDEVD